MGISKYFTRDHVSLFGWIKYQPDDYLSFLIDLLRPKKTELILDDGSGNGRFSIAMAKKGASIILLDINKRILRTAVDGLAQNKLADNAQAVHGDIQHLPFRSNTFDKVLCVHNLWYVPDYNSAVREMLRTLGVGGEVVIDHLNILNWRLLVNRLVNFASGILRRNPAPIFYRTPRTILRPFREFRFEVWNLVSSKGKSLVAKGESSWSMRLIVKCQKSPS